LRRRIVADIESAIEAGLTDADRYSYVCCEYRVGMLVATATAAAIKKRFMSNLLSQV